MPAVSQAQRSYLNATKGHAWVKRHGFDNPGKLPAHAHGRNTGLREGSPHVRPTKPDEALFQQLVAMFPKARPAQLPYVCGRIDGNVTVLLVDGDQIKLTHDMDFVEGGNGLEDPKLCGKNEVVVDANIAAHDWPFIAYHEAVERAAMADEGLSYDQAHARANSQEKALRLRASGR